MQTTFLLSAVSLAFGLLFFLLSVVLLGAPVLDIGMLSTAGVFVLFGALGLILHRVQAAEA